MRTPNKHQHRHLKKNKAISSRRRGFSVPSIYDVSRHILQQERRHQNETLKHSRLVNLDSTQFPCCKDCACPDRLLLNRSGITSRDEAFLTETHMRETLDKKLRYLEGQRCTKEGLITSNLLKLGVENMDDLSIELLLNFLGKLKIQSLDALKRFINRHSQQPTTREIPSKLLLKKVIIGEYPNQTTSFSDVYRGEYKGKRVAVKFYRIALTENSNSLDQRCRQLIREALIMHQLAPSGASSHPHILPLRGIVQLPGIDAHPKRIGIVTPWMNSTLRTYVDANKQAPVLNYMRQVLDALIFLHGLHFVHCDLKGANILMKNDKEVYLADPGLTITSSSVAFATSRAIMGGGTLRWMAPELLQNATSRRCSYQSDLYSWAITVWEVWARQTPFYDLREIEVCGAILRGDRPVRTTPNMISDKIWILLCDCWKHEPELRPQLRQVLQSLNTIIKGEARA